MVVLLITKIFKLLVNPLFHKCFEQPQKCVSGVLHFYGVGSFYRYPFLKLNVRWMKKLELKSEGYSETEVV